MADKARSADVFTDNYRLFEAANAAYATKFTAEGHGTEVMPPARKVAILTCMDARLHPSAFLGLNIGDAHVIRNAGGRATDDALRSLVISQRLLGTEEIHVIHHTNCGMMTFSNEQLRDKIKTDLGTDVPADREFFPFSDLDKSVRDDLSTIRSSNLVAPATTVFGHVYDVETGKLRHIV
eukprot:CAMPEP_0119113724 /NCGR_PEP_ID=MMETSP1180-20130426/44995_1 /TAXON_ID=3052 ORGANISM="Chlamydomonas cf sp, Strain CCMP681" /NCGR_SAMPLE_ID=MMETSP1180 /ASSEMBLY_ACC=CAM_ASM_000741 /LENGTH=179 /DNA_ID=CAMNT_0007101953 /DNA_START=198 /DNA_END=737 /DNA_ORIENTATION=+